MYPTYSLPIDFTSTASSFQNNPSGGREGIFFKPILQMRRPGLHRQSAPQGHTAEEGEAGCEL